MQKKGEGWDEARDYNLYIKAENEDKRRQRRRLEKHEDRKWKSVCVCVFFCETEQ